MDVSRRYAVEPIGGYGYKEELYTIEIDVALNTVIEFYIVTIDNARNSIVSKIYAYKI